MKHIVAGGAGFIGSHLCRALLARGDSVLCVDNMSTGRLENIIDLINGARDFDSVEVDVDHRDFASWHVPHDVYWNLACPASPVAYQRDPVRTMLTNVNGTLHGLVLAKRCGGVFVQASTSEVYGDPIVHPQSEWYFGNVDCNSVRACYDEGKRAAETLCCDFQRRGSISVRIVRIFNTYGPCMASDDGRVVSNFINQALDGVPLTVYGDGSQTRSLCYVHDLVDALLLVPALGGDQSPINLGNPHEITMLTLATLIGELCEREFTISYAPLPQADPKVRCPDISRAHALLGWLPQIDLREGLRRTIAYFVDNGHRKT